ncbi:unnamed protein product [Polarella glacialis]|uniref:Uncharacterized protein n=2 Tax=Polarella glacialis TaxID=89957 RepID=A0A813JIT8_POLGL|nr:unnamed protein product [Polarella glacialis]
MIRLYPQVVQQQKDIQELRQELASRQSENKVQISKLSESAENIEDLHTQLEKAEQEQVRLTHAHVRAHKRAAQLRSTTSSALEVRANLTQDLERSTEEHLAHLASLAHSESESHGRWQRLFGASSRSQELASQLGRLNGNLQDFRQRARAAEEVRGVQREGWAQAVEVAAVERSQVCEARAQVVALRQQAANTERHLAELSDEAVRCELAAGDLWQARAKVEGEGDRHSKLLESLETAQGIAQEFQRRITLQMRQCSDLRGTLEQSEEQSQLKLTTLRKTTDAFQALRNRTQKIYHRSAELNESLSETEQAHRVLAERHNVTEEECQKIQSELKSELDVVAEEGQQLRHQGEQLESESQDLQRQLGQAESQKENLVGDLAKKEEVHEELLVRKAELEAQLQELKGKLRCTIC